MWRRCRQAADALRKAGIGKDDTVSVFSPNGVAALEMHYAAGLAGGVLNPINYRLDAKAVGFILGHAESKAFLADSELMPIAKKTLADIKRPPVLIEIGAAQAGHPAQGGWIEYEDFIAGGDSTAPIRSLDNEWQAISLNLSTTDPFRLDGRVALISGGATGLGYGMADAIVRAGGKVVLLGRREDMLRTAAGQLGTSAAYETFDVTKSARSIISKRSWGTARNCSSCSTGWNWPPRWMRTY